MVYATTAIVPVVPASMLLNDAVTVSDFQSVLTAMEAQISVSTVVTVVAAGATAAVGLVFMWWGVRKLTRMLFGAFRKGKMST